MHWEIIYSDLFNGLNGICFTLPFNKLITRGFIDYFPIHSTWSLFIPIITHSLGHCSWCGSITRAQIHTEHTNILNND